MKINIDGEKLMESFYDTPESARSWSRAWWLINHAKLADVRENVRGEWVRWNEAIKHDGYTEYIPHCKCSECGTEYDSHTVKFINFCPNCGADMRGQTHEENN